MVKRSDAPDLKQLFEGLLTGAAKDSAQQVWLAGLGALAKAQQEGGRVFEALVKEGAALQQQQNPSTVGAKFAEAAARFGEAGARAAPPWSGLETIFEERVAKALARLGLPSAADMKALQQRVDELTARLDQMAAAVPVAKTAPARRSPARRA